MVSIYALLPLLLLGLSNGAPQEDLIVDLPGLDYPINFKHYSGYLNGTDGRHLHYWFTESQDDPSKDPLVLWLNGGPGCSSVSGLLTENGPYFVKKDGSGLYENPYSWNLIANVLYLESPACVGFSYDDNSVCRTKDDEVAEMNYLALKHFYEKFPEYRQREFFVTGESYGGIYIPTLSVKIVEGNADYPINFQGYAIGNGLLSYVSNQNSVMFFGHYHDLIGEDLWNDLVHRCCGGIESRDTCDFFLNMTLPCETSVLRAMKILYLSGINMYNIYEDCATPSIMQESRYTYDLINIMINNTYLRPEPSVEPPCIDDSAARIYMNTPDVREALHIPTYVQDWDVCSNEVSLYYIRTVFNVSSRLLFLHKNKIRSLIYNGDIDMVCNFLGNEWDVEALGLDVVEKRREWTEGGQVAGFVKRFDLLDFLTLRGSGHMVPEDKPAPALKMFTSFIRNEPY